MGANAGGFGWTEAHGWGGEDKVPGLSFTPLPLSPVSWHTAYPTDGSSHGVIHVCVHHTGNQEEEEDTPQTRATQMSTAPFSAEPECPSTNQCHQQHLYL